MPPRWLCVTIVLFWLVVNGWLLWHDLLPRFQTGNAPPYTVDLVEEAQTKRPFLIWAVDQDGQRVFQLRTKVTHPQRDRYEMTAEAYFSLQNPGFLLPAYRIQQAKSVYRVTTKGELVGLDVQFAAQAIAPLLKVQFPRGISAHLEGQVESGRFSATIDLGGALVPISRPVESVELSSPASILLPLHPVHRMRGLKPGQSWSQAILDPLSMITGTTEVQFARATVRDDLEDYTRSRRRRRPCLIVDYQGERLRMQSWVEDGTGDVLCQDVTLGQTNWSIYRD